jgi:hypothetical protein
MKKIRIFFSATATLLLIAACVNKEEIEGNGHGFDEATFTLSAVSVENTGATIQITSEGAKGATYYGFLTDDVTTAAASLVSKRIGAIAVTRHILSSGNTTVDVKDLRQGGKAYRYIVTGLLANGTIYNDPVELTFTTAGDFANNSVGTISYPNPVSEPTTVKFEGFPGKYVYGFSGPGFDLDALKKKVNDDLDSGSFTPVSSDLTVSLPISEAGDYVVYAYELDEKGAPTLSCALFDLHVANLDFSVYESYLGDWFVNGIETEKITISEKQRGVSYLISGIPAVDIVPEGTTTFEPAVLDFDMATGTISLAEQDLSTFVYGSYGTGMKTISGIFSYGGSRYRYYPFNADEPGTVIFTGIMGEDGNIATVGGECGYGPFVAFSYSFVFIDGSNKGKGSGSAESIEFPFTLTREVAAPTEEYLAWIGTWYTENGEKFVIEKDKTNSTYAVTGFFGEVPAITRFNAEDGTMSFYGQEIAEDANYSYQLLGRDQDNYVESGSQDGTSTLAIATLSEDGKSFALIGNEYEAVYSGTTYDEIIVKLEVFAIDANNKIYGVGDKGVKVDLPHLFADAMPGPSEDYLAWIGDWDVVRVPESGEDPAVIDTWTIAEKKVNSTYTITGIENAPFEVEAIFDKDTKTLSVAEQVVASMVDDNENNVFTVCLYGEFEYQGNTYYWGESNEPVLFTATIGADGTAQMEAGCPYEPYIPYYGYFVDFRFFGFVGPDYNTVAYSEDATLLPNVMAPAAGAPTAVKNSVSVDSFVPVDIKRLNTSVAAPASYNNRYSTRGTISHNWELPWSIAR